MSSRTQRSSIQGPRRRFLGAGAAIAIALLLDARSVVQRNFDDRGARLELHTLERNQCVRFSQIPEEKHGSLAVIRWNK